MMLGTIPVITGAAGVKTLTFVAWAAANASSITVPATAAAGDLAVLFDYGTDVSDAIPSGWTGIAAADRSGNNTRLRVSYKLLVSGDPSASIAGMNGGNNNKVMAVFRPDNPIKSVSLSTWSAEATSGNPAAQSVTASSQPTPLLVLAMAACAASTAAFSTASPAFDATQLTANSDLIAGYKIYNSTPADHSVDMNDLGNDNALASGFIEVS